MPKFTHRLFKNCLVKYFCLYGYFIDFGIQSGGNCSFDDGCHSCDLDIFYFSCFNI